jgi:cathepsin C
LDHILKCSYYNQGCHGGYSYLTGKFFKEFEIMTSDCFDRNTCSNKCKANKSNEPKGKLNIKADEYYYVGDYYGYTNEDNIYADLRDNGPMVISLAPSYLFSSYKSGVFDVDSTTYRALNIKQPEWQKVDHSVVLVGYGIENGKEYWMIQNSWGVHWGDNGYMKLRKGKNLINIESLAEGVKVSLTEDI